MTDPIGGWKIKDARANFSEERMVSAYLSLYHERTGSEDSPYTVQNRPA